MNIKPTERRKDHYDAAAYVITLPFLAIAGALKITASAMQKKSVAAPPETPPKVEQPVPSQPLIKQFRAADQVHSETFGSQKVCFYLYNREREILAVARKDGKERRATFTQTIADDNSLPFAFQGAVKWIRDNGFIHQPAPVATSTKVVQKADQPAPTTGTKPRLPSAPAAPEQRAKRPFEGRIVSFGETTRGGKDGKKPYQTFYLTLCNDGIGEREYIGEQLSELIQTHNLQVDQLIRIHPLGKRNFEVEVNGKMEARTRNEYAVDIL